MATIQLSQYRNIFRVGAFRRFWLGYTVSILGDGMTRVALTWFDDTQAMRISAASPEYAQVRNDEPNFIAPGPLPFIITKEHVIVA